MTNQNAILHTRLLKLEKNYINQILEKKNFYDEYIFKTLKLEEKAVLEAYLKRFAFLQDFLGEKVFPLLLSVAGINASKMSEVLYKMEKDNIIDSLGNWIELREIRNELEHDYPTDTERPLKDLAFCINSFELLEKYYLNSWEFAKNI